MVKKMTNLTFTNEVVIALPNYDEGIWYYVINEDTNTYDDIASEMEEPCELVTINPEYLFSYIYLLQYEKSLDMLSNDELKYLDEQAANWEPDESIARNANKKLYDSIHTKTKTDAIDFMKLLEQNYESKRLDDDSLVVSLCIGG